MSTGERGPLAGIRVIDFTRVLAGPFATQTLADLGADVIKVEHPHAPDQFRFRRPSIGGDAAAFLSLNRNKRSLTLDLATPGGKAVALDLLQTADVLVENYTSRVMRTHGLDYAAIAERFPRLIYCSISAYGRTGSRQETPGYDPVVAAESGVAWLSGTAEGPPNLGGVPIIDIATAQNATTAILAALLARSTRGTGQFVETSLYDTAIQCLSYLGYHYLAAGEAAARDGRHVALGGAAGFFDAADGVVMIIASSDRDFRSACAVVGAPELADREDCRTFAGRLAAQKDITATFTERLRQGSRDDWVTRLRDVGVPAAPYLSVGEALTSAITQERGLVAEAAHPRSGSVPNIASALRLSATPVVDPIRAPALGEHNDEILAGELGYDEARLQALRQAGAFG